MKNKLYYILIVILIIYNVFLINKHSSLKKELIQIQKISTNEKKESDINDYTDNPYELADSKYLDNIKNIHISSDTMSIKFSIDAYNVEDIVRDTDKCLNKTAQSVSIQEDKYIILEYR